MWNRGPHRIGIAGELQAQLNRWTRRSIFTGFALILSSGSVVPFLAGHALHAYWREVGVCLVYISMALLSVFLFSFGALFSFWLELREATRRHSRSEGHSRIC